MITPDTMPVGICPACGETVKPDEDCVWTCRADLSRDNGYALPGLYSEEELERDGDYSQCPNSHGGFCPEDNHLPLHVACYERGDY